LPDPFQFRRVRSKPFYPALNAQRLDMLRLPDRLGPQLLPCDLRLDQRAARCRLRGNDRYLQPRIVEQTAAQAEGILTPDFHLRQSLPDAVAFTGVVIDEQEGIEPEAQFLRNRTNVADLVVPVDAPGHEIIGLEQPLCR